METELLQTGKFVNSKEIDRVELGRGVKNLTEEEFAQVLYLEHLLCFRHLERVYLNNF